VASLVTSLVASLLASAVLQNRSQLKYCRFIQIDFPGLPRENVKKWKCPIRLAPPNSHPQRLGSSAWLGIPHRGHWIANISSIRLGQLRSCGWCLHFFLQLNFGIDGRKTKFGSRQTRVARFFLV
jgi:hypothetical protein